MASKRLDVNLETAFDSDRTRLVADDAEAMPARDPRRIAAAVAMFERLAEHWSLRGDERETLLGGIPKSTWSEWRQRPAVARIKSDTRERIANLFVIDLNAHALFAPEFADRWVRESNAAFGNESPLSAMLRGKVEDIILVRRYLEGVRSSSPRGLVRSDSEPLTVSALPGDAFESDEADPLPALRQAAAIFERLASGEAARYGPALAMSLSALATRLEQQDDAEAAPVLRRAVEIQAQLALERPAAEAEDDGDEPGGLKRPYKTYLEPRAADVMMRIGFLDPLFNPALLARLRDIEFQPFACEVLATSDNVRIAHLTHRGVAWRLLFVISEALQRIEILSIELVQVEVPGPVANSKARSVQKP
jgi:hypothetical protein